MDSEESRAPGAGTGDAALTARRAAAEVGLSLAAFWREVSKPEGWLPKPVYPAPRAPRWRRSELLAALEATRALPAHAKAARRAARLAAGSRRGFTPGGGANEPTRGVRGDVL